MKYKKIIKIFFAILYILTITIYTKTEAKQTCTTQERNNLIQLAHNVKIDYELSDDRSSAEGKRYYKITVSNITEGVYITHGLEKYMFDLEDDNPGIIVLDGLFRPNGIYYLDVYASNKTNCSGEFLLRKTARVPSYNIYTEKKECQQYPDFRLCNKSYQGSITDSEFNQELNRYINKLNSKAEKIEKKEQKTMLENIIAFYVEKREVTIPITVTLFIIIGIFVSRMIKKQKQTKIKI